MVLTGDEGYSLMTMEETVNNIWCMDCRYFHLNTAKLFLKIHEIARLPCSLYYCTFLASVAYDDCDFIGHGCYVFTSQCPVSLLLHGALTTRAKEYNIWWFQLLNINSIVKFGSPSFGQSEQS